MKCLLSNQYIFQIKLQSKTGKRLLKIQQPQRQMNEAVHCVLLMAASRIGSWHGGNNIISKPYSFTNTTKWIPLLGGLDVLLLWLLLCQEALQQAAASTSGLSPSSIYPPQLAACHPARCHRLSVHMLAIHLCLPLSLSRLPHCLFVLHSPALSSVFLPQRSGLLCVLQEKQLKELTWT